MKKKLNAVDSVIGGLGGSSTDAEIVDQTQKSFKRLVTVSYRDVIEKCATTKLKQEEKAIAQRKLDESQRLAAASLSTQAVVENFVSDIIDNKAGKLKRDNIAYEKMLSFDDQQNPLKVSAPVLVGDEVPEEHAKKRELTKSNLSELKRIKSEMRTGNYQSPKNSKSPPSGGKIPAGKSQKGKGKGKQEQSQKQLQKGGKGKGKRKGSEPLENSKGKGKGKKGKGKGKGAGKTNGRVNA